MLVCHGMFFQQLRLRGAARCAQTMRTSIDAGSSSGDEGTAAIDYFLGPIGLRSGDAGAIAIAIARRGRLHFTHSINPLERRAFLHRFLSMYHPDNYLGSAVVAEEVAQYLRKMVPSSVLL